MDVEELFEGFDASRYEAEAQERWPEGVAESLLRTCESTIQVAQALFPSGQGAGTADAPFEPELRVADGVAATAAAASPSP